MEQDITTTAPVMNNDKSSNEKRWKITTIIASAVAVCSVGFGVYGIM